MLASCVFRAMEVILSVVPIDWTLQERAEVEAGISKYPAESGHCAALARIIHRLGKAKDERTRGIQLHAFDKGHPRPWLILKRDRPRIWASHTLVETVEHRADALTGADGCPSEQYLEQHFQFHELIQVREVDVFTVDTWIERQEGNEP